MIFSHNPIAFPAAAAGGFILDDVSGSAGGWSIARRLRSAYSGSAIRVRRSSDDAEQDIGFASDILDEASLETFCSATDGFITTVYSQSAGSLGDMVQATDAEQPQIVSSGTMNKDSDGNAFASFDGSDDDLGISDTFSAPWTFYSVFELGTFANNNRVYGNTGTRAALRLRTAATELIYDNNATSVALSAELASSVQYLIRHGADLTNVTAVINDGSEATAASTDATSRTNFFIGFSASFNSAPMDWYEMLWYDSDVTADDSTFQTNINDFYSIF